MGQRGPKPLPANVHLLRGNPSKKRLHELFEELRPEVDMPSMPSNMWPEARAEWRRLKPELIQNGLVSRQDRASLVMHCETWAEYCRHRDALKSDIKAAAEKRAAAEAEGREWDGGDGVMIRTANGNFTYSHHWVCKNKAFEQLKTTIAYFGLAVSLRSGIKPSDNRQASLFEEGTADEWNAL